MLRWTLAFPSSWKRRRTTFRCAGHGRLSLYAREVTAVTRLNADAFSDAELRPNESATSLFGQRLVQADLILLTTCRGGFSMQLPLGCRDVSCAPCQVMRRRTRDA
ncbi:hypothetical protein HPB50_014346 [Hyalomma asiaticum]|uniref:Uncharacterized protein n=1 Tax=Hyalomma asiaticum TaxID=266040 RepID=A0ACB7SDT9_HYAAI|nr:hypothetical protein HPB50_014346 [Hyalomma asiaticum]